MRRDDLEQLLRTAARDDCAESGGDRAAGRQIDNADLLHAARRIATRRRRRDAAIVAVATLPIIVLIFRSGPSHTLTPQPVADSTIPDAEIAATQAEIVRLRFEADQRLALVGRMRDLTERPADAPRDETPFVLPPAMLAEMAVNQAAFAMLAKAQRIEGLIGPSDCTDAAYELVIQEFPDTASARAAKVRLGVSGPG